MSKTRVAIICGGRSSEHEISCISAGGILAGIDRTKYEPILIGITQQGDWVLLPNDYALSISNGALPHVDPSAPAVVADIAGLSSQGKNLDIDIIFPVLHGPYGEDGTIQGFCEMADIAYVGSGVLASSVAMDKSFAKPIFAAAGIKVAEGFVVTKEEWANDKGGCAKRIATLGYPVFVKPARGGSSRGTHKVHNADELEKAITDTHTYDRKAIIENAVGGKEIECAILEFDGAPHASVVGEIKISDSFEFYDFEAKYLDGATTIELPAPIPAAASKEIQEKAIKAFVALGCAGLARVDFFYTSHGEIIINELNTMPGFTPTSVFPKMWAATGKNYTEIISALLTSALTRTNGVLGN
jgi:D-alanine-D-alanine ligase